MKPIAYYNEIDPFAAQWLRNLIAAGHIAPGDVDTRSITDVSPDDIRPYTQCHFFAGIGVWSYALRLAGWSDDRPVWTGSCPCQPFSAAGKGEGFADDRHLYPAWANLIRECRPARIYGEQVEAAIRHGWIDLVQHDLEANGYAFGKVCLPAASVGAPHIRSRLWFVADSISARLEGHSRNVSYGDKSRWIGEIKVGSAAETGAVGRVGDTDNQYEQSTGNKERTGDSCRSIKNNQLANTMLGNWNKRPNVESNRRTNKTEQDGMGCFSSDLADTTREQTYTTHESRLHTSTTGSSDARRVGDTNNQYEQSTGNKEGSANACWTVKNGKLAYTRHERPDAHDSFWRPADWLYCRDGKWRPVEPGTFPLADGVTGRVGRLRAYGNAIVPQVAAEIIRATM